MSSGGLFIRRPPAWRAPARPRPRARSPPARRESRSRGPGPASTPAPAGSAPAARAGLPRAGAILPPPSSCSSLPRDPSENPVHQPSCLLSRVPLRECDSFVDDDLERDACLLELVGRDAEDVPLDGAEPVGRPLLRGLGDAAVELVDARRHGFGRLARELVDLALVQRGQGLARHVPLVAQGERRATRGAPAERHPSPSIGTSTVRTAIPHIWASASATCRWTSSATCGSTAP